MNEINDIYLFVCLSVPREEVKNQVSKSSRDRTGKRDGMDEDRRGE